MGVSEDIKRLPLGFIQTPVTAARQCSIALALIDRQCIMKERPASEG
jgi:hypothetical protein